MDKKVVTRRSLLAAAPAGFLVATTPSCIAKAVGSQVRVPERDEVNLRIFQYATGDFPLKIHWGYDPPSGHVHDAQPDHLYVNRPFEFRIEPRWTGGRTDLDVIFEVKVDADIDPSDPDNYGFANQWSQLTHLGPQTKNREMAQIGQHITLGRGPLLHPMPGRPILWHFRVDFQLGSQSGPKLVGEGRVLVERLPS